MQKKLFLCGVSLYTSHMTATQEALAAMAKAEEDQQEWLLEKKDLRSAK